MRLVRVKVYFSGGGSKTFLVYEFNVDSFINKIKTTIEEGKKTVTVSDVVLNVQNIAAVHRDE